MLPMAPPVGRREYVESATVLNVHR